LGAGPCLCSGYAREKLFNAARTAAELRVAAVLLAETTGALLVCGFAGAAS
jgi:hypothetical protein